MRPASTSDQRFLSTLSPGRALRVLTSGRGSTTSAIALGLGGKVERLERATARGNRCPEGELPA